MNPKTWVEAVLDLIWRIGARILIWGALLYLAFRVRSVIAAVILAAVLTYAILPLVDYLCKYRVRGMAPKLQRLIATTLVFIVLASFTISLTVAFFAPFQAELKGLSGNLGVYVGQLRDAAAGAHRWYVRLDPDVQKMLQTQNLQGLIDKASGWSSSVLSTTVDIVSHLLYVILIPVLAFFFTLDSRSLKKEFLAVVPRTRTREALAIMRETNLVMRSYITGQIILCVIAGIVVGILLHAFDMEYVLILSVFAGLTRAVPVIGPIVSGIAIVILGLLKAPMVGVYLLIFFTLLHFAESKFIMPKLIGDRMDLHPAVVIIALLIGAEFFGILGMFMAAPVTAIARVLIRYYYVLPARGRVRALSWRGRRPAKSNAQAQTDAEPLPASSSD